MLEPEEFELFDIADQAAEVGYLTPIEYAKLRDLRPQRIYQLLRNGKLASEQCRCGRRIICVQTTDEVLEAASRARSGIVDTRPDGERTAAGERAVVQERTPT